ncbi:Hypothetical predicted protein [Paramuricea clavata]|nr:Hypothetical predicted protein [Paramuricea clavata]
MQFAILYSIGPLLWQSFFNIIFLLVYNVFIVLTGGLGLLQFEVFRRDEIDFCANVEYFLFLLYPPCCVLILMWLISLTFGANLAPYLIITMGFPMCHTFLDPKLRPSFTEKHDHVLGHPEKMLALFNFILSPSFVYCLVNLFDLLQYSAWISVLFCVCVPLFLVTLLDTTDLRDMADIRNSRWQIFQVFTGCLSLILGAMLAYIHGIVDGINAVYLAVILLCTTTLFVAVKYRFSKLVSSIACGLLLTSYLAWLTILPWNLVFSMGSEIKLSFFTVEVLVSLLAVISVLAVVISLSVRYRSWLNQVLILHTFGFVVLEIVMMDGEVYSPYLMVLTSALVLYLVQRLHEVRRLNKTPALTCISLHGSKLLFMFTSLNAKPKLEALSSSLVVCGGFCLCGILMNALLFEHEKHLDRNKVLRHTGIVFMSLVLLSSTFLRTLYVFLTRDDPSPADIVGLIFLVTGACFAKLAFLHSNEQVARKQSILVIVSGILVTVLQPYFNILEIFMQIPKLIFREMVYETWHVIFAEYMILPWCMLLSLSLIMVLLLKLLSLKEISPLGLNVISILIGAPLGLYIAHWVLPYPKLPSSILSIPYMISATISTNSLLLAIKGPNINTNVKMYIVFLGVSILSVAGEMNQKISITFLQSEISPSVLYHVFLHLVMIIQGQPQTDLQISLDKKNSMFPSIAHNASVLLIIFSGLIFSPKDYYDILLVPICGLLLLLRIKGCGVLKNGDCILKRVIFTGVLGLILYYRVTQQLPWGKWSFWTVVVLILEISVTFCSLLVYVITLSVFWYECIAPNEGLFLAVFAPLFTLLLFYGRTTAGQVLGIVGPALAYNAFYYPSK